MAINVVQRDQPRGISIIVAGAGVGGLMAALECWRVGCDVRVLERAKANVATGITLFWPMTMSPLACLTDTLTWTLGDSFSIGKSAIASFKNWPWMKQRHADIVRNPLFAIHDETGTLKMGPIEPAVLVSGNGNEEPFYRHSRPKFHGMLLEQLERVGLTVEYNCQVEDYFEDTKRGVSGVTLKDGSRYEADLVVAADGVRGTSWSLIAGSPVPARSSGSAVFRTAYPIGLAIADTAVAERFKLGQDGREISEMWMG